MCNLQAYGSYHKIVYFLNIFYLSSSKLQGYRSSSSIPFSPIFSPPIFSPFSSGISLHFLTTTLPHQFLCATMPITIHDSRPIVTFNERSWLCTQCNLNLVPFQVSQRAITVSYPGNGRIHACEFVVSGRLLWSGSRLADYLRTLSWR